MGRRWRNEERKSEESGGAVGWGGKYGRGGGDKIKSDKIKLDRIGWEERRVTKSELPNK